MAALLTLPEDHPWLYSTQGQLSFIECLVLRSKTQRHPEMCRSRGWWWWAVMSEGIFAFPWRSTWQAACPEHGLRLPLGSWCRGCSSGRAGQPLGFLPLSCGWAAALGTAWCHLRPEAPALRAGRGRAPAAQGHRPRRFPLRVPRQRRAGAMLSGRRLTLPDFSEQTLHYVS